MNTPQDGGPAFPQHVSFNPNNEAVTAGMYFAEGPGMSLRDWFAGMAMQGAAMYVNEHADVDGRGDLAKSCYAIADAMLLARLKNEALRAGE